MEVRVFSWAPDEKNRAFARFFRTGADRSDVAKRPRDGVEST